MLTARFPRCRDGRRSEGNFSGHNARVQQDAVVPHSTTVADRTAPALPSGAACVSPAAARVSCLNAQPASLAISQPRVAVPESGTAEHEVQDRRHLEIILPGIVQEFRRMLLRPTPLQQPT